LTPPGKVCVFPLLRTLFPGFLSSRKSARFGGAFLQADKKISLKLLFDKESAEDNNAQHKAAGYVRDCETYGGCAKTSIQGTSDNTDSRAASIAA